MDEDDDMIDVHVIDKAFRRLSLLHQQLFLSIKIDHRLYSEVETLPGFTKRAALMEMSRTMYWLSCHLGDVVARRKPNIVKRFWRSFRAP